jgi:hypothetical protein
MLHIPNKPVVELATPATGRRRQVKKDGMWKTPPNKKKHTHHSS